MPENTNTYYLKWDETGKKYYEHGVSKGVLFPQAADGTYANGVAWNGLTNVTKSPEGAEPNDLWADNIKYGTLRSAETFSGSIEAYTYPKEFRPCLGLAEVTGVAGTYIGQQAHKPFGFCFRTEIGDDAGNENYKLHIVYGATVSPSEESYDTINDSPDAITFSWDFDTIPVDMTSNNLKPTSCIVIDSREANSAKLAALEAKLYGTAEVTGTDAQAAVLPQLPTPSEIITMMTGSGQ